MSAMFYKPNSKLSLPVVISIALHVILIAVLGYNALQYSDANSGSVNGQSIDAIMVDPSVMTEQYQRQLQSQMSQQKAEQQRQEQLQKQSQELQEKQLEEQQRLKEIEKERLKAIEQQKQETEAAAAAQAAKQQAEEETRKAKAELEEQQKQAALAKQKAEQEAKERAQQEKLDKERIENERKQAEQEAEKAKQEAEKQKQAAAKAAADKAAADKAAKQKAAAAKNNKAVDDILGGLTSGSPSSPGAAPTRKGTSDGELDKYKSLVLNAISNKFINPNKLYSGRNCVLKIQIAPDGLLLNVVSESGDDALCREAISATKLAVIPKPSSTLYQEVKVMTLDFQPK